MIFPDKPRPSWQYAKPQLKVKIQPKLENKTKVIEPKPPPNWRANQPNRSQLGVPPLILRKTRTNK